MTDISFSPVKFKLLDFMNINQNRDCVQSSDAPIEDINIRIYHTIPIIGGVKILINSKPFVPSLKYGSMTSYKKFSDKLLNIRVFLDYNSDVEVLTKDLVIDKPGYYTLIIYKRGFNIDMTDIKDSPHKNNNNNLSSIRLINMIPNSSLISLILGNGGPTIIKELEFLESSSYMEIKPNSYVFEVESKHNELQRISSGKVTLEPNHSYTLYCSGDPDIKRSLVLSIYEDD